jgi:hypothetical protein
VTLQFNPNIYREPEEDHSDRDFILQALSQLGNTAQTIGQNRRANDQAGFQARLGMAEAQDKYGSVGARRILRPTAPPRKILGQSFAGRRNGNMVNGGQPMSLNQEAQPLDSMDLSDPQQFMQARQMYGSSGVQPLLEARKYGQEAEDRDLARRKTESDIRKNDRAYGAGGGPKLSPGYRWTNDGMGMEPIPGGPADAKAQKAQAVEQNLLNGQLQNADLIMGKVGQALKKVSGWTAGMGSKLSGIPTTDARDLAADLETIKANLGFQQLQEMRRQSPTGGALGNVSERELTALQSSLTSLDQAQSPEQLRRHLNEILVHYTNWKQTVQGQAPMGGQPQAPGGFDADKERRYQEWKARQGAGR